MNKIKNKIIQSDSIVGNIMTLAGGAACAQILTIITSPLITRLYSPDDFGVLAVFNSVYMMLLTVVTLKFDAAIPIEKDNNKAKQLLITSVYSVITATIIIGILLFVGVKYCTILQFSSKSKYLWLLPLGLLGSGLYTVLSSWVLRKKEYITLTKTRIYQSLSSVVLQILLGLFKAGPWGLLISSLIAQTNGIGVLVKRTRKDISLDDFIKGYRNIFINIKEYYRYPLFIVWTSLMNVAGQQAPPLILSAYLSTNVTGLYALGMRVVQSPITLVSSAVSSVFMSKAKDENMKGSLPEFSLKLLKNMMRISIIPFGILLIFGPELFSLIFGEKWKVAGIYVQLMTPWLFTRFSASPLTAIVLIKEQQSKEFTWQTVMIITRILSLFYGVLYLNDIQTIAIYGIVSFIISVLYFIWMFSLIDISLKKLLKILQKDILIILLQLFLLIMIKCFCKNIIFILLFLIIYVLLSSCFVILEWRKNKNDSI